MKRQQVGNTEYVNEATLAQGTLKSWKERSFWGESYGASCGEYRTTGHKSRAAAVKHLLKALGFVFKNPVGQGALLGVLGYLVLLILGVL